MDLVFEAFDKGFWAAVKNFMDSTKIPIILTSNDTTLPQKFEGKFEHYKFKAPSIVRSSRCLIFGNIPVYADESIVKFQIVQR